MKILVCGLPGSGKTQLAKALVKALGAIHLNADVIRATLNRDLGFSLTDRVENARRLGCVATLLSSQGHITVTDFVCPIETTHLTFAADFTIWMNTIKVSRYADTNAIFETPVADSLLEITAWLDWEVSSNLEPIATKATVEGLRQSVKRRESYVPSYGELLEAQKTKENGN